MRLFLPNKILGKGPFFLLSRKIFNKLALNIVQSENIQTFCGRVRRFVGHFKFNSL